MFTNKHRTVSCFHMHQKPVGRTGKKGYGERMTHPSASSSHAIVYTIYHQRSQEENVQRERRRTITRIMLECEHKIYVIQVKLCKINSARYSMSVYETKDKIFSRLFFNYKLERF